MGFCATLKGNNSRVIITYLISLDQRIAGNHVERNNVAGKASYQARNPVDDVIRDALEIVRQLMLNGTAATPILDPFFIEYLLVNFESPDAKYIFFELIYILYIVKHVIEYLRVSLILQIDNTWVTHMAEFIIDNISTNMVRLTMELALSCKRIILKQFVASAVHRELILTF